MILPPDALSHRLVISPEAQDCPGILPARLTRVRLAGNDLRSSCAGLTRVSTPFVPDRAKAWMAGSSPAKTKLGRRFSPFLAAAALAGSGNPGPLGLDAPPVQARGRL